MKRYKNITFMAYRNDKGATGGPGGVLCLQKELLGISYENTSLTYKFKNGRNFFQNLKGLYLGAFLQVLTRESIRFGNYYICNEIGTAFALACLHKKYSLIYHQQGPILEENHNFKTPLTNRQRAVLKMIERGAFRHAKSVHFPSAGAEKMFFESAFRSIDRDKVKVGRILPNTILDHTLSEDAKEVNGIKKDGNILSLLSVGTLTEAKGQDQALKFVDTFLSVYREPVRYIIVGQGPMKQYIVSYGKELERKYSNFTFIYIPRLPHDDIMKLNNICDVYIMLHRISIFDLATLEAMSQESAVVLSKIGGNIDFNVKENVIFADSPTDKEAAIKLAKSNISALKKLNYKIFWDFFSPEKFRNTYQNLLSDIIGGK